MKPFEVYPLMDITLERGEGVYVFDNNGERYLDFYGGHAVISIGHSHPHYIKRISEQLSKIGYYSNSVHNPLQIELAHKLGAMSGLGEYDLFLCNSGAEANENALKLASFYNKRKKVIAFSRGFHGRTSGAVAATDNPKIVSPYNSSHDVTFLPLDNAGIAKAELKSMEYTAVIVEGIQGIAGVREPAKEFLVELEKACFETNTIFVLDEVQSGYGRTGDFFAYQQSGIKPDIVTTAKGMGNGFPVGGVLVSPKFDAKFGMLGTTFGGNHLACAASLAVLEVMEEEQLLKNAKEKGQILIDELRKLKGVKRVFGRGLMIGVEMNEPIALFRKALARNRNILTGTSSNLHILRVLPPLNIGNAEIEIFLNGMRAELEVG
ncbi:MAG: aspartate aminotransferase family protein [Bacteroidales bacterium]